MISSAWFSASAWLSKVWPSEVFQLTTSWVASYLLGASIWERW